MAGRKQWDPRESGLVPRFKELNKLASETIGDGKRPNLFFVSVEGDVSLVTSDFTVAYRAWKTWAEGVDIQTDLEDRLVGVLASVEPESDEPDARLIRIDNTGFLEER